MSSDEINAKGKIWGLAAIAGVVAFLALKVLADYSFGAAVLLAILIAILVAILIWIGFYRDADETGGAESSAAPGAAGASAASASTTSRAAPKPEAAGEPATAKAKPAKKPATKKPATKKPAAKAKPAAKGNKPKTLKKPRAGGADDLKLLKGVGPAVEITLNGLGIFHFDQIAGWSQKDIARGDQRLRIKGRIKRDGWIEQTKSLAKTKS
ncbi:MAG: NADH:quinone oxidoreductase [Paracoccaceae bacterium]